MAAVICLAALPAGAAGLYKPASKKPAAQALIDQAWTLQATEYSTANFRRCIAWMEQADRLDPNNHTILTDLARYYWQLGDSLPRQTEAQRKTVVGHFNRGQALAERSMKIRETADGHYWYAVNLAAGLEFSSFMSQVAAFPSIYSHTQYVMRHDPDYDYGAPGRLWAEILSRVPKSVVETVGKKYVEEAAAEIDRALKKWPLMICNYVYKARFIYHYYGDKEGALKLLDQAMKMDVNAVPGELASNRAEQQNARKAWKEITGKDYPAR